MAEDRGSPPAADDSKVCPRCAETVRLRARVCPFCGHEFEVEAAPAAPPAEATPETAVDNDWERCPICGQARASGQAGCSNCGYGLSSPSYKTASARRGSAWMWVAVLFALVALGGMYEVATGNPATNAVPIVSERCTVGLTGAAVSVTIQGVGAQSECDSYRGQTTNGASWYIYSGDQAAGGAVICQETVAGRLHTVRDQGLLNDYGTQICRNLINAINAALATPAPVATPPAALVPSPEGPTLGLQDTQPFSFDPNSNVSLYEPQHQYLYYFIKPCPRAGCETATLDPRFAWTTNWDQPIPEEFQPCLSDPNGAACYHAVTGQ